MFIEEMGEGVDSIKGVGPRTAEALARLGVDSVGALLALYPRDYEDRTRMASVAEAAREAAAKGAGRCLAVVEVKALDWIGYARKRTLKALVSDGTAVAALLCFGRNFLEKSLQPGRRFLLSCELQNHRGALQASAFELEDPPAGPLKPMLLPVYPLGAGITQRQMRTFAWRALQARGEAVEESLPAGILRARKLMGAKDAARAIHFPKSVEELLEAKRRLVYEELFLLECSIGVRAARRRAKTRAPIPQGGGELAKALEARLPFTLTEDQARAIAEIRADLRGPSPMARLLQGDVGSGKTLVAFFAALDAIEAGGQAAMMAPTELLARQHADNAARLLEPLGVRLAFLSGNVQSAGRQRLLEALARGDVDLAIGTHALFSKDVEYANLRLALVDEQHRFGVAQRAELSRKGAECDVLVMTATPIPRTLALTAFGDLAISTIRTMPAGRKRIVTHLARQGNEGKVYDFVRKELAKGRQAYFVYPLIEKSEALSMKDAESMLEFLSAGPLEGYRLGLIHSRKDEEGKRAMMADFTAGKLDVLVATSVVEVGVDVPNATCMVVEHAERFGLAALHQLRGRVGRGTEQSYCFLVYSGRLTEDGTRRMKVMLEKSDGFEIAEEDLRIRGPGEIAGKEQSGYLKLRIADPARDATLLAEARAEAFAIIERDPAFLEPEHAPLRERFRRAPPFASGLASKA